MSEMTGAIQAPLHADESTRDRVRAAAPRTLLALAVIAAVLVSASHREILEPGALEARLASRGPWAPIVFILLYAVATVAFFPGSLLTIAGGAMFGPVLGALYSLVGATLGSTASFSVARYIAADWVGRRSGSHLGEIIEGVSARGWRFIAFVRLVPLLPFNALNYALGLTSIRIVPYVVTSFLCMIPGAIAYAWLGHAGRSLAAGSESSIKLALIALGLLGALALVPSLLRKRAGT